jgi:hypothetical protein
MLCAVRADWFLKHNHTFTLENISKFSSLNFQVLELDLHDMCCPLDSFSLDTNITITRPCDASSVMD